MNRLISFFLHLWLILLGLAIPSCQTNPTGFEPQVNADTPAFSPVVLNVLDFGASMDGVQEDHESFQAAIDSASRAGGGVVKVPPGTAMMDIAGKTAVVLRDGVTLRGAGRGVTVIRAYLPTAGMNGITFGIPSGATASLQDLTLHGPEAMMGSNTTEGVLHLGGSGRITVANVLITDFTVAIRSDPGTVTVEVRDCELKRGEQGIFHAGGGTVRAFNSLFKDTRTQEGKLPPGHDHGIYAYQNVSVLADHCTFSDLGGYGVQLFGGSGSPESLSFTSCVFDSCGLGGILAGNSPTVSTIVDDCTFKGFGDGVVMQGGPAVVRNCRFMMTGYGVRQLTEYGNGSLTLTNSQLTTTAGTYGAYMGAGGTWTIAGCQFSGSGSGAIGKYDRDGTLSVSSSIVDGSYTIAALDIRGGTVRVSGCRVQGNSAYAIQGAGSRTGFSPIIFADSNQLAASVQCINLWPNVEYVYLYGSENLFKSGSPLKAGGSSNGSSVVNRLKNRKAEGPAVASALRITLDWNYSSFRVTGSSTIQTISMAGIYDTGNFGLARVSLVADGTWSLGTSGNIVPSTTSPRAMSAVINLFFDPMAGKWYEGSVSSVN